MEMNERRHLAAAPKGKKIRVTIWDSIIIVGDCKRVMENLLKRGVLDHVL